MDFRPGHPGPVRLPARAAPGRPERLDGQPAGRGQRAGDAGRGSSGIRPTNKSLHLLTVRPELSRRRRHADLVKAIADQLDRPARAAGAAAAAVAAVRRPGPRPRDRAAAADRHRRGGPAPVEIDFADRPALPALRRRRVRQVVVPAGARHHDHRAGSRPSRPGSSWSTTGAACWTLPESDHRIGYGIAGAEDRRADASRSPVTWNAACPARTSPPQQLRDRSWWTGPELFVLVDDYDLVASGPTNPLHAAAGVPAAGPRHRPAPGAHPPGRRGGPGAVRAGHPAAARAGLARPGDVGRPGRGRTGRPRSAPDRCRRAAGGWSPARRGPAWSSWPTCRRTLTDRASHLKEQRSMDHELRPTPEVGRSSSCRPMANWSHIVCPEEAGDPRGNLLAQELPGVKLGREVTRLTHRARRPRGAVPRRW